MQLFTSYIYTLKTECEVKHEGSPHDLLLLSSGRKIKKKKGWNCMKQPCKKLLSIALVLGLLLTNLGLPLPKALEPASTQVVYPVLEDAYIRSGSNASKNYNYEGITAAHGQQYVGKGYKVINSKYGPDRSEIIGVMKFDLPTPEEIEQNGLNQFLLAFSIFKNPNPNEGDQSYLFHYTTDNNWSETALT